MLDKNKLKNKEVIYVGDEIRDMEACKKAKVAVIGVSWGYNLPESLKDAGANYIAKTPKDILRIVKKKQ